LLIKSGVTAPKEPPVCHSYTDCSSAYSEVLCRATVCIAKHHTEEAQGQWKASFVKEAVQVVDLHTKHETIRLQVKKC